jgi:hypothetical protein
MSEAVKPDARRRGPVDMPHPLELPIDPETGDPVMPAKGAGAKKQELLPGKDRFKLDPAPRGWFRGQLANVQRTFETTEYGQLVRFTFDVIRERREPPLKAEMVGYTFSKEIRPGLVVQAYVGDTLPTERVRFEHMKLPLDPNNDLRAHMPVVQVGRKFRRGLRNGILAIAIPFAVICALIGLGSIFVW